MLVSTIAAMAVAATMTGSDIYKDVRADATPPVVAVEEVKPENNALRNSVQWFDNIINVTNRVMNRSIFTDLMRVHTEEVKGELVFHKANYDGNKAAVQEHCKRRLMTLKRDITPCGPGYRR